MIDYDLFSYIREQYECIDIMQNNKPFIESATEVKVLYLLAGDRLKELGAKFKISQCPCEDTCYNVKNHIDKYGCGENKLTYVVMGDVTGPEKYNGFQRLKSAEIFVQQKVFGTNSYKIFVYYNNKTSNTVIFLDNNLSDYGITDCASSTIMILFIICPWIFKKSPLTDTEKNLLNLYFTEKTKFSSDFENCFGEFIKRNKFKENYLKLKIGKFVSHGYQKKLDDIDKTIIYYNNKIESYRLEISRLIEEIETADALAMGYMEKMSRCECDDSLAALFSGNKCIEDVEVIENRISFSVVTHLTNVNEQAYEQVIVNDKIHSCLLYNANFAQGRTLKKFWKSAFETNRFKIRVSYRFSVDDKANVKFVGCNNGKNVENTIRNPHAYHNCFGGFGEIIAEAAQKKDIEAAVYTLIQYTRNLNLFDRIVCQAFMNFLNEAYKNDRKIMEDESGKLYTIKEVIEILDDEE